MVTRQIESLALPGDLLLKDGKVSGLLRPSLLRMAKVATIDEHLVAARAG
jgi:hypothetical protein